MIAMWVALAVVGSAPAGGTELHRAVTGLVSDLALPSVEGFSLKNQIAVGVDGSAVDDATNRSLGRAVEGLVRARLELLGAAPLTIPEGALALDARARRAGAEWLLLVRLGREPGGALLLWAELRAVDRGLWNRAPEPAHTSIYATAERRLVRWGLPPPPPPSPDQPDPRPQSPRAPVLSEPLAIATWPGHVFAMAACPGRERDRLVVLGLDALTVFETVNGKLVARGRMSLADLPRADAPVRAPMGAIVCGPEADRFAFAHGRLQGGFRVKLGRTLEVESKLPAAPLAHVDGRWLSSAPERGTNQWATAPLRASGAPVPPSELGLYELQVANAQGAWRSAVLTRARRALVQNGGEWTDVGPSGAGITLFSVEGRAFLTLSGATFDGERDLVRVVGSDVALRSAPTASIEGRVEATAVGRFQGAQWALMVAAFRPERDATDLVWVDFDPGVAE